MAANDRPYRLEPASETDPTTLLLAHGTGGDEHDLVPLGARLAPGAALLSPRGTVREGGANRFFARHAEGVFDVADLDARAQELATWVREACAAHDRPLEGLLGLGFSNGANILWAVAAHDPTLLRGAVLLAPMLPLTPAQQPDLDGLPVLIGAGRADPIAPPDQAEALAAWLRDRGAQVELRWHEGGHQPGAAVLDHAQRWLAEARAGLPAAGGAASRRVGGEA